jgi:hypothetical protein
MSGIHCQDSELGIWQYAQGNPQAGAGTAVGRCLAIRPVACERATPAMACRFGSRVRVLIIETCTLHSLQVVIGLPVVLSPAWTPNTPRKARVSRNDRKPGRQLPGASKTGQSDRASAHHWHRHGGGRREVGVGQCGLLGAREHPCAVVPHTESLSVHSPYATDELQLEFNAPPQSQQGKRTTAAS